MSAGHFFILIESIYSGVYCLANEIHGMKEIIEKTKYGVLVNDNNLDKYENEINNFVKRTIQPDYDYAKNIIERNYSVLAISKQFEKLYDELS